MFYFSIGNGQPRETGTLQIVSAHFRSLVTLATTPFTKLVSSPVFVGMLLGFNLK